jgi:hypothetical protein
MALVSRAHGKLLAAGFLPSQQTEDYERWIDASRRGDDISFYKSGKSTDVFRVHGREQDKPEFDEFNSYYTQNLSEAIRVSRFK